MRPLTQTCPKTLLLARGHPFAWHQLHWLAAQGISEVVYSIGHQGEMIRRYWAAEPSPVPSISYVDEGERLRGTAGALRLARDQGVLDDSFFVIYGDSFLPVEFAPVWRAFQAGSQPALMTVLRNEGRWDRSNVIFEPGGEQGRVVLYDKESAPGMQYIDYGLSCFHRDLFDECAHSDLSALFHHLSMQGRLAAFEVHERFYEIGSPSGLRDFERYIDAGEKDASEKGTCETSRLSR
jgi:NDP-sugar pyrophosphorylase family protein